MRAETKHRLREAALGLLLGLALCTLALGAMRLWPEAEVETPAPVTPEDSLYMEVGHLTAQLQWLHDEMAELERQLRASRRER